MNSTDAKAYVDNLYRELHLHWERKISQGPFMTQLREGRLPLPCARRFFKDWGLFFRGGGCSECRLLLRSSAILY